MLQTGTQEVPVAWPLTQFPGPALEMAGREEQEGPCVLAQAPETIHCPALQLALGVPTKPVLHKREQDAPDSEFATQVPALAS